MTQNSEIVIDDLIKRIYRSYVEIKVGEFREIDRDMLLHDIGLLYTSIKNLFPTKDISFIELESELKVSKNSAVDNHRDSLQHVHNHSNHRIEETETPIEKKSVVTNHESPKIDFSMFEDEEELKNDTTSDLIDKKSDNTSSPILKSFQNFKEESKTIQKEFSEIPKIAETHVEMHLSQIKVTTEEPRNTVPPEKQALGFEQEKKNTNNIIDFLHHEENKVSRDIYSLLDLNTRIGLVELFFKGNSLELTECLVKLNKLDSRDECLEVINKYATRFGVSKKEDIYQQLVNLVDRKLDFGN